MVKSAALPLAVLLATLRATPYDYTYSTISLPGSAIAINNRGDIVGYGPNLGFLYSSGNITTIAAPNASATRPQGINDAGDIVGSYTDSMGLQHGFEYSRGTYTTIDAPSPATPGTTELTAVNNRQQIAGNATSSSGAVAFVYTAGVFSFVNGRVPHVAGLNDAGELTGSAEAPPGVGGRLPPGFGSAGTFLATGAAGSDYGPVNNKGRVISNQRDISHVVLDSALGSAAAPISFPGAQFNTAPTGLNDLGVVVGTYGDGSGQTLSFIATPLLPPACQVTGALTPERQLTFSFQDPSGLAAIVARATTNASVNIPPFASGTTSRVTVTATAVDGRASALVDVTATNEKGFSQTCVSRIDAGSPVWSGLGGILVSNITVAKNQDGALEAFGIGTDNALWHRAQAGPGGSWSTWSSLGGNDLISDPAVVLDSNGDLAVFVIAADGSLWTLEQSSPGDWSQTSWQAIATGVQGRPAAVLDVTQQLSDLEVFARGVNNDVIWMLHEAGTWRVSSLGGVIMSNPAVALDITGMMQVFATGSDGALWNIGVTPDLPLSFLPPWTTLGGLVKGDPAVIARSGLLYAFVRGVDDALWVNQEPSLWSWSGWNSLGGVLTSNPTAAVNSEGRVEAFVAGSHKGVWHKSQTAPGAETWNDWTTLGGVISGDVFAVADANSSLNLFVIGSDSGVWQIAQSVPGGW
ncbi:MAG TPA: hypothetical protein VN519_15725 [Bryobacteraceae bacterium]|nr:hypothetical protein [Bryobacteraceae bacterium]